MDNTKLKIWINYDLLETNSYEFNKRLLLESKKNLFKRDKRGNRGELDYMAFASESSRLMDKILREKDKDARQAS